MPDGRTHVRVTNQIFPQAIVIPMSNEMTITQWHVPVDDKSCYWFSMFTSYARPVDKAVMREQRLKQHRLPDYRPITGAGTNYGFDADEQAGETFTGMGRDINVHDQWAVESMGAIQDRREEHLGKSDVGIVRYRRLLRDGIRQVAAGEAAPFRESQTQAAGPVATDSICATDQWEAEWLDFDTARRAACPWPALLEA